jgi:hypothetical protein
MTAALALAMPAVACGSQAFSADGSDGGAGDDGTTSDAPSGADGAPGQDGATGEGGAAGGDGGSTPFDTGPAVDVQADIVTPDAGNCAALPDTSIGAFVSPSATSDGNCDLATPCKTIKHALTWAKNNARTQVYLDKGTYIEQVTLVDGVNIHGGWYRDGQGNWHMVCADPNGGNPETAATIQAPDSADTTIIADSVTARLELFLVHSSAAAVGVSQSIYGIKALGTAHLTLNGVAVIVKGGGAGSPGGSGMIGGAAPTACSAGSATPSPGTPGTPGAGATPGTFSNVGYAPSSGQAGGTAGQGMNGSTTPPMCQDCIDCGLDMGLCSYNGPLPNTCGGPATPGCGGFGGTGGGGGSGGGSSVALFAWGATVDADFLTLAAGPGGAGAPGGGGGGGGAASAGTAGTSTICDLNMCTSAGGRCHGSPRATVSGRRQTCTC